MTIFVAKCCDQLVHEGSSSPFELERFDFSDV